MKITTTTLELCKYTAMAPRSTFAIVIVSTRKLPMPLADSWASRKLRNLGPQVKETTPSKKILKLMTPNLHFCLKALAYVLIAPVPMYHLVTSQRMVRSLVLQM